VAPYLGPAMVGPRQLERRSVQCFWAVCLVPEGRVSKPQAIGHPQLPPVSVKEVMLITTVHIIDTLPIVAFVSPGLSKPGAQQTFCV
jgi:hypothetical protein